MRRRFSNCKRVPRHAAILDWSSMSAKWSQLAAVVVLFVIAIPRCRISTPQLSRQVRLKFLNRRLSPRREPIFLVRPPARVARKCPPNISITSPFLGTRTQLRWICKHGECAPRQGGKRNARYGWFTHLDVAITLRMRTRCHEDS